jgi:hypothetical protein
LRGALSYAVARAVEGDADSNGDGRVTVKELFTTVRQMVYQLSNQRQNIVAVSSPSRSIDTDVVFQLTRGVAEANPARRQAETLPPANPPAATEQVPNKTHFERPVRLASLDGNSQHFAGLTPREVPFEIVAKNDNPDIFWDPATRDVIDAYSDVVAYKVDKAELPNVIDRAAAIRELKLMRTKDPQVIKIGPDDSLHRNETQVQIELNNTKGRALIMFNITGDGTVQMLYPKGSDLAIIPDTAYSFPVKVREPFGHDQIVAITSEKRMSELEQVLLKLDGLRAAAQMIKMVQRYVPKDARIGSAGLYTAP